MSKHREKILKVLMPNDSFPEDFWNYRINHVVGYWIPPQPEYGVEVERKYGITPTRDPN